MEIKFTEKQYESLLKLVYLGNWMINAIRLVDEQIKEYENIEQYIFSFAKDAGLENWIEFDNELNKFYPTKEFEENTDVEQFKDDYDDELFWEELTYRLGGQDFIREYGETAIRKMTWEERFKKEQPFIEKYEEEFEKYGIENLEIKEEVKKIIKSEKLI